MKNLDDEEIIKLIVTTVVENYRLPVAYYIGRDRGWPSTRDMCYWMVRECTTLGYREIGFLMGGRDPSAIQRGVRVVKKWRGGGPEGLEVTNRLLTGCSGRIS